MLFSGVVVEHRNRRVSSRRKTEVGHSEKTASEVKDSNSVDQLFPELGLASE